MFADIRAKDEVHEGFGIVHVFRGFGNGEAVDEEVRAFGGNDPAEFRIGLKEDGAFPAPNNADRNIAIEKCRFGAIGIEDLHEGKPICEHGFHFFQIRIAHVIDRKSLRKEGPSGDLAGVVEDDDLSCIFGFENIRKTLDVILDQFGVNHDADRSGHERNTETIIRIEAHFEELRRDIR